MTPDPDLTGLHEILLPGPVSWLPQTVGWYVLLGLILLAMSWWGYRRFRHFLADRYRRLALAELSLLEEELKTTEKRIQALTKVPVLLKRTALSAYPRTEVAGLSGQAWLAFLDRTLGGKEFTEGPGRLLRELAYLPAARLEQLPEEHVADLLRLARRWLEAHVCGS